MKKKLLIFHPTIAPYRIDFFNDLFKSFQTRICLQYKNLKSQKFDYEKIASCFVFTPIYLKLLFNFRGRSINRGYVKQLKEFQPDIVLVSEFGVDCLITLLYRFLTRSNYKVVSLCDDSYNMVVENNDFTFIHRSLRSIITPFLDEIILVEPKITKWYQEKYKKGVFFPIIKKEDETRSLYKSLLPQSEITRDNYGLKNKKIFLFVGRLVKIKNIEMAIRAYADIETNSTAFVIVGSGPEETNLHNLANKLCKNVIFTGRLEGKELLQWYNIAHCFILPSYLEPFGAVTNEALLAGCIGLISKSAGSQCLISYGDNGYTFNPLDKEDLVQKMSKILSEITIKDALDLKKNLMILRYDDMMSSLIKSLD